MTNFLKPYRKLDLFSMEASIQERAAKKPYLRLPDLETEYLGQYYGYEVHEVDAEFVRTHLSVLFGLGGHGYVHEFIDPSEIWVAKRFDDGTRMDEAYLNSLIAHEAYECTLMKSGMPYWEAHNKALEHEKKLKFIPEDRI